MKAETIRTDTRDATKATADDVRDAYFAFDLRPPQPCESPYERWREPLVDRERTSLLVRRLAWAMERHADTERGGDLLYFYAVIWHFEQQPLRNMNVDRWTLEREVQRSNRTMADRAEALREEGAVVI